MKMLDHQKKILKNLSHNRQLLRKEIEKSIDWLSGDEVKQLERWLAQELTPFYDQEMRMLFKVKMAT